MSQQAVEAPMNWFRQGLFAPVTEELTAFDLRSPAAYHQS
jgi:hypothetical protein